MVDDEEALCLGVRRILQKYKVHVADVLVDADYEFRYFTSGEHYLAWLDDGGEFDLLLLDLKLPGRERPGRARRQSARAVRSSPS